MSTTSPQTTASSTPQQTVDRATQNAILVRTLYDAYNARRFDDAVAVCAEDVELVNEATGEVLHGPEGVRAFDTGWATAFPDSRVEIRSVIAADDAVTVEFRGVGTQTGVLRTPAGEIPPTGRSANVPFCDVVRVRDGRVTSIHTYFDSASMMRQLGLA
jgi:steroid delta-isomerase-like uncharacterized protein